VWWNILLHNCQKFTAESNSERLLKIRPAFGKVGIKNIVAQFFSGHGVFVVLSICVNIFSLMTVGWLMLQDSQTGEYHQIWFDNVPSLSMKYKLASDQRLLGVGVWEADSLDYSDTEEKRAYVRDMWNALPDHH